ncbi:MAG: hypothetical protein NZM29_04405 [Nitrospira sp.]|nr:hypothetical protein [Nitrospira sp.]
MPLLLPRWQADRIEELAHRAGMSAARFLRRLIAVQLELEMYPTE